MTRKKFSPLTQREEATLHRLEQFAQNNKLDLFNVRGSLFDRVRIITSSGGMCPCKSDRTCPCSQCIQECKEKGECFCRVFVVPGGVTNDNRFSYQL